MIDRCYSQTDLVALHDLVNLTGPDWEYYLALASTLSGATGSVLDAGCGTGGLTIKVARLCAAVTGLDPAEAMLAVAPARIEVHKVPWQQGALQNFQSE